MSGDTISIIALCAGAIILVAGYIRLFFNVPSRTQKFIEKAKEDGNYATATLVKSKLRHGTDDLGDTFRHDRMKCIYEYQVDGVVYKKKLTFESPGLVSIRCPHTVTVYYNSKKPSKGICEGEGYSHRSSAGCLWVVALSIIVFWLVYGLLKFVAICI